VLVDSATMINSTEAVGINFYPGGSVHGLPVTTNVTFQSIVDRNSDYTVAAESYYGKGAAYCKRSSSTDRMSGVVIKNFSGMTSAKHAPSVAKINCPQAGTCGLTMSGMNVKAHDNSATFPCSNHLKNLGVACSGSADG
jgi:galacturan 1,4-alpha-galacturonidase